VDEPTSDAAAYAWINEALTHRDPYAAVALAGDAHREAHGCTLYASNPGHWLGAIAASTGARRILEIGGGFGYGTLWLAHGAGRGAVIETIESDPGHAAVIEGHARQYDRADQIRVHVGFDAEVLPTLAGPYDLIVYDADIPGPGHIAHFERLARRGGTVSVSNLFLGRYAPDRRGLADGAAFREQMLDSPNWLCAFAGHKLVAVRR
jgi:predicted O-methyltransferase YrrM